MQEVWCLTDPSRHAEFVVRSEGVIFVMGYKYIFIKLRKYEIQLWVEFYFKKSVIS